APLMEQEINHVKELNANALRVYNFPPHPYLIELCDRRGLLLLAEMPLHWTPSKHLKTEQFVNRLSDYMSEVLTRDKNNVSVIAWGIGGPYSPEDAQPVNHIYQLLNQFDHRPVYMNANHAVANSAIFQPEIMGMDIFNIDHRLLSTQVPDWLSKNSNKVTIISSFGSPFKEKLVAGTDPTIVQELQVLHLTETWRVLEKASALDGFFITSLGDWECDYSLLNYGPRLKTNIFPSGLKDGEGNKRFVFAAVKSLFIGGKTRINPGILINVEHPGIFPLVGVISLLIFLFIYNSRRYVQENMKRIFIHPHGFFVDLRDKRKIPESHTLLLAIFISLGLGLVTATLCFFYKENIFFDHLLTLLTANGGFKEKIIALCWKPELATFLFSLFYLVAFLVLAIFIQFFAFIFRKKLQAGQALTLVYWIGAVYLFLIPIGMILYRILLIKSLFLPTLIVIALLDLWFFSRLVKALRVVYFWSGIKATIFFLLIVGAIVAGLLYYYQQQQAILDYLKIYAANWMR
ncbi:hypothetical protein L0Z72_15360, partial [candidate division KSB1 bacterium]|nr:hypothetical protein [candidate division KSB1 bacterium]